MASEQAQRDEARAKFWQERATELRAERAQIMEKERGDKERGDGATGPHQEARQAKEPPRAEAKVPQQPERAREATRPDAPTTPERTAAPASAAAPQRRPEPTPPRPATAAAPLRAGEQPGTAEDHAAINRTQEAEKRHRVQQDKTENPTRDTSRAGPKDADTSRKETPAERAKRYRELSAIVNAKDQGHDRGGGGRGGGGNSR